MLISVTLIKNTCTLFDCGDEYLKIRINYDDHLPLEKTSDALVLVRSVFNDKNTHHRSVFREECSHKVAE